VVASRYRAANRVPSARVTVTWASMTRTVRVPVRDR
jgi:hypothetical protein